MHNVSLFYPNAWSDKPHANYQSTVIYTQISCMALVYFWWSIIGSPFTPHTFTVSLFRQRTHCGQLHIHIWTLNTHNCWINDINYMQQSILECRSSNLMLSYGFYQNSRRFLLKSTWWRRFSFEHTIHRMARRLSKTIQRYSYSIETLSIEMQF